MSKRATIGTNPLDAVIPFQLAESSAKVTSAPKVVATPSPTKQRMTVHLTETLINRVKNAVYWTPGLTLASLSEDALTQVIERLEAERGEPFPQRSEELKGGRPLK